MRSINGTTRLSPAVTFWYSDQNVLPSIDSPAADFDARADNDQRDKNENRDKESIGKTSCCTVHNQQNCCLINKLYLITEREFPLIPAKDKLF